MRVIQDCKITQSNAQVLQEYCDDQNNNQYSKNQNKYSSCVKLSTKNVYSPMDGTIVYIGNYNKKKNVIIRLDDSHYINLKNLNDCSVKLNDDVQSGSLIGSVFKYVEVEYLTTEKSKWQFRIGNKDMYKNDPEVIVTSSLELYRDTSEIQYHILSDYSRFFKGDSCPASSFVDRPEGI